MADAIIKTSPKELIVDPLTKKDVETICKEEIAKAGSGSEPAGGLKLYKHQVILYNGEDSLSVPNLLFITFNNLKISDANALSRAIRGYIIDERWTMYPCLRLDYRDLDTQQIVWNAGPHGNTYYLRTYTYSNGDITYSDQEITFDTVKDNIQVLEL